MCGIYGWVYKAGDKSVTPAQREVISLALALANEERGSHSWGVYRAQTKLDGYATDVERAVGPISECDTLGAHGHADVVMGHTRFASTGTVSLRNCHPFKIGDVTLAHNGMVHNHAQLGLRYNRAYECDSEHLAHHLADRLAFRDMEGYGAIQWVRDANPGTVHLSRLRGGVLALAGIGPMDKPVALVWSSDERHLHRALTAAGVEWFDYKTPAEGRIYIATPADACLYVLPDTEKCDLAPDTRTSWSRMYDSRLTSGSLGGTSTYGALTSKPEVSTVTLRGGRVKTTFKSGASITVTERKLSRKERKRLAREERATKGSTRPGIREVEIVKAPEPMVDPSPEPLPARVEDDLDFDNGRWQERAAFH